MHTSLVAILLAGLTAPAVDRVEIRVLNKDDGTAIAKAKVIVRESLGKDSDIIETFQATDEEGRVFSKKLASGRWPAIGILVEVPRELVPPGREPERRAFLVSVTAKIVLRVPIVKTAQIWVWDEFLGAWVRRTMQFRKEQYRIERMVAEECCRLVPYYDPITGQRYEREERYKVYRTVWETRERWVPILQQPTVECWEACTFPRGVAPNTCTRCAPAMEATMECKPLQQIPDCGGWRASAD